MTFRVLPFVLAMIGVCLTAPLTPCSAATPLPIAAGYWQEFWDYWEGVLRRQDGVVMTVLVAGAIALFIITRVKGNKS
ncbi:MAG: hypothetical protein NZ703_06370 [Gemmataceae bacterium]|nr:hypothetical protein [Gemmataceae bacterium]